MAVRISVPETLAGGFGLFRVYGPLMTVEFAAVHLGLDALFLLVFPETTAQYLSGGWGFEDQAAQLYLLATSAVVSLVFGFMVWRVWHARDGSVPGPETARRVFAAAFLPLVVLSVAADYLALLGLLLFIVPALLIAAYTTALVPALVIEGRRWAALPRALSLAEGNVMGLCAIWGATLLPWLFLAPAVAAATEALVPVNGPTGLLLSVTAGDLVHHAFGALGVCLTVEAYTRLLEVDAGGSSADTSDIFR